MVNECVLLKSLTPSSAELRGSCGSGHSFAAIRTLSLISSIREGWRCEFIGFPRWMSCWAFNVYFPDGFISYLLPQSR